MSQANHPARLSKVYPIEKADDDLDFFARLNLPKGLGHDCIENVESPQSNTAAGRYRASGREL
ncbi:hypothetical protein XH99_09805 [Bradyrhizobium nanningense]|uniref:Uncharacterized protein n=1 Tax=Bradyrhizobium nanningense TaxID=1325118 RepID=A0A4Q0SB24_9BRAD|nr:hypothetical protein [Bradyrhizobium nanningense]RXH33065.1 hypothetical protein XH99_09805 [Bradyrhizobium nanningense]